MKVFRLAMVSLPRWVNQQQEHVADNWLEEISILPAQREEVNECDSQAIKDATWPGRPNELAPVD